MRGSRSVLISLLALAVCLAFLPVAAARATGPKLMRVWWSDAMPENLEPQTNEYGISDMTRLVYEGLTRFDEHLNLAPGAAESWEFNADGTVITFHLRDHLIYSDGTPLTAERFRYAIGRSCDGRLIGGRASYAADIVGCAALYDALVDQPGTAGEIAVELWDLLGVHARDEHTLEIQLTHPTPYFPAMASWVGFLPVRQELIETGGAEWWRDPANLIGNGPFVVSGIEMTGPAPQIALAANERYWGGRPRLDGVRFMVMTGEEATTAYLQGDLETTWPMLDDLAQLEADPKLSRELVRMPSPSVDVFHLNWRLEPFSDKRVREAFAYAFDRAAYCREMLRGACTPLLSWMPPQAPGAIETDAYSFNPEQARAALAASSYGGAAGLPEIIWYYDQDDAWGLEQAEWLRDQFQQVLDVEMTLAPVPWDDIVAMQETPETWPQLANTYWWADPTDPHGWLQFWTCGHESFTENVGYCNPAYDALVAQSDREMDPDERIRLAQEAQRVLVADAPAIFGYTSEQIALVQPYVTGYTRGAPYQGWPGWATPLTVDIAPH